MIRYALVCSQEHEFESWFRSSADFDDLAASGMVTCPVCASTSVQRALMAPSVVAGRAAPQDPAVTPPAEAAKQALMVPDADQRAMLEALTEMRRKVTESADYVGDRFAEEARKMHYGESDVRGIYGEATSEEARALADEGIEVHPLPRLPDDQN